MAACTALSAFRGKADMTVCGKSAFAVAIGGKADMTFCSANVGLCLRPPTNPHRRSNLRAPVTRVSDLRYHKIVLQNTSSALAATPANRSDVLKSVFL